MKSNLHTNNKKTYIIIFEKRDTSTVLMKK